ncbi:alpha/beta-hydrolase [Conidiobolus coronatus NRRL 28638]|uniref:Alpha/beta-hydrolase n=1 Tax=Conidiobolus coronatus (strain ATCC 28846 / CBS 209.66 / NRRL 28638) TaxID=796925 RepID=A0A137PG94_CONC2|nr:alpha/beta-hydrolase [Conidiobolus coronatus NRRL 28638]|eukprot:KXN74014.1 alpha/beta-hydrolase [Conidiobolus coronatus NRRL 28638]
MDYGSMVITGFIHDKKMIIVSHRGTANLRNWLRNISYGQVAMRGQPSNVRIHEGFLGIYRSTDNSSNRRLDELLADPKYKDYKVVFTGVSLGAATATIHAFDAGKRLKDQGRNVELFTYVGPRVGNRAFVDNFINLNITTGRYTNGGDIVSKMYPRTKGYVHIPGEFFNPPNSGANVITCSQTWDEDPNCGWSTNDDIRLIDHAYAFGELQKLCPYN